MSLSQYVLHGQVFEELSFLLNLNSVIYISDYVQIISPELQSH